jgi:hypothetical protein
MYARITLALEFVLKHSRVSKLLLIIITFQPEFMNRKKIPYQLSLSFEVQRQYAKAKPRVKSIRDAKESVKAVAHYPS